MEQKSSFQHQLLHKELFQICKGFKNCFRSLILDQIQIILHSPSVKTNWIELMWRALLQLLSSLITLSHVVICSATKSDDCYNHLQMCHITLSVNVGFHAKYFWNPWIIPHILWRLWEFQWPSVCTDIFLQFQAYAMFW